VTATGIVCDARCLDHLTDDGHPENPRRLAAVYDMLEKSPPAGDFVPLPARVASREELLLVHTSEYIDKVAATAKQDYALLGPDTQVSKGSFLAARLAAGGFLEAVRRVVEGRPAHAFALVRPPGHHAEKSRALGYCIFNNAAIGAAFARKRLGLSRVMVVDWDVHHGNGTQHIFEQDPSVLFFSIHQYPHFPKTGYFTDSGIGPGEGYTVNLPLPKGFGDNEYAALFLQILTPIALEFAPDLVLVSAGFDNHGKDPLGGMTLTERGFAAMTRCLMDIARQCCQKRMALVLEGGYEPKVLAASVRAVLEEMAGQTVTDPISLARLADRKKILYATTRCVQVQKRFWKSLTMEGGPK